MSLPAPALDTAVLVTGASSGIGAELSRQLAGLGHDLAIVARDADRLEAMADELRRHNGVSVLVVPTDLGKAAPRKRLVDAVRDSEKTIVGLCNAACFGSYGRQPLPNMTTYAATKAFVQAFSESLHGELAGSGVSCTTLAFGLGAAELGARVEFPPDEVAAAAIRGMLRGRRSVIPGVASKALAAGGRFAPRSVLLPAARRAANGNRLGNLRRAA